MPIAVVPTLEAMAGIYSLDRDGGARSPRFAAYTALAARAWGVSEYNPMTDAAIGTVAQLRGMQAEAVVQKPAEAVLEACEADVFTVTLAVVVASGGLWTEKLLTEVHHAVRADRRRWHGLVRTWAQEPVPIPVLAGIARAETVRVLWHASQGPSASLASLVAREGLAGAMATEVADDDDLPGLDALAAARADSTDIGTIAAFLFGDDVAKALGWAPLGVPLNGGQRWAMARALGASRRIGYAAAVRSAPAEVLGL